MLLSTATHFHQSAFHLAAILPFSYLSSFGKTNPPWPEIKETNKHCSVPKVKQEVFNMMSSNTSATHIPFFIFEQVNSQYLHHGCLTSWMCSLVILLGSRELSPLSMTRIQRPDSVMHSQIILETLCLSNAAIALANVGS